MTSYKSIKKDSKLDSLRSSELTANEFTTNVTMYGQTIRTDDDDVFITMPLKGTITFKLETILRPPPLGPSFSVYVRNIFVNTSEYENTDKITVSFTNARDGFDLNPVDLSEDGTIIITGYIGPGIPNPGEFADITVTVI